MSKKLGVTKTAGASHSVVHDETVEHALVPGRAYEINDPATKLMHMIGGGFFNEPKYYDPARSPAQTLCELFTTGTISKVVTDDIGLSTQAKEVIEACQAVAKSTNPEDLLVLAAWARDTKTGLKLRYTPQIMACIAANNESTKGFLPKYSTAIVQRADEIVNVFAAYRHLFSKKEANRNKGVLPAAFRKFLAIAFANQSLYSLLKYDSNDRPNFKDILLMIRGKFTKSAIRKFSKNKSSSDQGWPLSKSVFNYFVKGEISDDAPEMLSLRKKFFATKSIDEVTPDMLDKAGLTWENIISKFGGNKQTWEMAIKVMGEMALIRNLRNFEQAGIDEASWDLVYKTCTSIADTKQLPFRFFAAEQQITSTNSKSINDKMLDNSCMNVPELAGKTAILVDNSGSCRGCAISEKSTMKVSDAGNMLSAVIGKRFGRNANIGVFGDSFMWVNFSESDSCMAIKNRIEAVASSEERSKNNALAINDHWKRGAGVGNGTETGLWCGIQDLIERKVHVDRIIICSDMCCYTQGDAYNCGQDMNTYFGKNGEKATIQSMLNRYRQTVNPNVWVHSVNLNGTAQAQIKPTAKNTQCISGWSEQIFGLMKSVEEANIEAKAQGLAEVPTIEVLRKRYQVVVSEVEPEVPFQSVCTNKSATKTEKKPVKKKAKK